MNNNQLLELKYKIESLTLSIQDYKIVESLFFSYSSRVIKPVDFILVLAGKKLNRVKTAVEVYQKRPTKIILSGGVFDSSEKKECERYFDYCIHHGVSKEDIILEDRSTNTYENLIYSIDLIQKVWFSSFHLLIISSPQHLFRTSLTLEKIKNDINFSFTYQCFPCENKILNHENWYFNKNGREEITAELEKIVKYHLLDS